MKTALMVFDQSLKGIQAMPLVQGQIAITSGVFTNVSLVSCVEDGDIEITWVDNSTTTVSFVATMDRTIVNCKSVEILSGTFDLS